MGFFPYHLDVDCKAPDHPTIRLPSNCSLDHYLDPATLDASPYAHRERSFLTNPRTPTALLQASAKRVRVCTTATTGGVASGVAGGAGSAATGADGRCSSVSSKALARYAGGGEVHLPPKPNIDALRTALRSEAARLLVFDDVLGSFGGWGGGGKDDDELVTFHEEAQSLLSSWCCTDDTRFKKLAGVIPYILPPLEGQATWRGSPKLAWAARGLAEVLAAAGETARAAEIRPS